MKILNINYLPKHQRLVQEAERLLDYSSKGDVEKEQIPRDILEQRYYQKRIEKQRHI